MFQLEYSEESFAIKAPAKLNLFLDVIGQHANGFHEILSQVVKTDLYDDLVFRRNTDFHAPPVKLVCQTESGNNIGDLPVDESNLIVKAAHSCHIIAQINGVRTFPVSIILTKRIPREAGLGGGSSDAAAAIYTLNELWNMNLDVRAMKELGVGIGSDVPLFFEKGLILCRGLGESCKSICSAPKLSFVLLKPSFGLATADVYRLLDSVATPEKSECDTMGDAGSFSRYNRLEDAAFRLAPQLKTLKSQFETIAETSDIRMSGSGTTLFSIFENRSFASDVALELKQQNCGDVYLVNAID